MSCQVFDVSLICISGLFFLLACFLTSASIAHWKEHCLPENKIKRKNLLILTSYSTVANVYIFMFSITTKHVYVDKSVKCQKQQLLQALCDQTFHQSFLSVSLAKEHCVKFWWKRNCEWTCFAGNWEGVVALHKSEVGVDLNALKKNQPASHPHTLIIRAPHCFKQVCQWISGYVNMNGCVFKPARMCVFVYRRLGMLLRVQV